MNRDFKGVWIPKEIYLSKTLSWSEKLVLIEIDSLDCGEKHCYASDDHFMEHLGLKRRAIQKIIARLKDLGYIELLGFDGKKRYLKSNIELCTKESSECVASASTGDVDETDMHEEKQLCTKVRSSYAQKCVHNNTVNNTDIDITNVISSTSHESCDAEPSKTKVFFNRKKEEFEGISQDKIDKLKKAYPNIDVAQEFEKIKLWLVETPNGKRRKGGWRFILAWFVRSNESKEYQNKKAKPETSPKKSEYSQYKPRKVT